LQEKYYLLLANFAKHGKRKVSGDFFEKTERQTKWNVVQTLPTLLGIILLFAGQETYYFKSILNKTTFEKITK
jgi:hypothetical protein